jgi:hypothetical protein
VMFSPTRTASATSTPRRFNVTAGHG